MSYDPSTIIPATYHEGVTMKNVIVRKDEVFFANAIALFNAQIEKDFNPMELDDGEVKQPVTTTERDTDPVLMVKNNYIVSNEDGIASIHTGTLRTELVEDIEMLYTCLKHRDASSAYVALNRISSSTKNILAENVLTTRIKPKIEVQIAPCNL